MEISKFGEYIPFLIECIGTIAFAWSGAAIAIKKRMDIFGVNILALATAVGGGILRDLTLGNTPPNTFRDPIFIFMSITVTIMMFYYVMYREHREKKLNLDNLMDQINFLDAIGLGAFTVNGIAVAYQMGCTSIVLLLCTGILTGAGGGVIRDILANDVPYILTRHIYASASLVGGLIMIFLVESGFMPFSIAMIIGATSVVTIRMLAARYKWNLPHIDY